MPLTALHPGEHLAHEMKTLGISAASLSRQINVSATRMIMILRGRYVVTGDTALRLAHFFGTSPEYWLNLQILYDLRLAGEKAGKSIKRLPTFRRSTEVHAPTQKSVASLIRRTAMPPAAIHPGKYLADELRRLGMSAAGLSREIKVPTNRVTFILNGQRAVTGDTALRLAHFFGNSPEYWLNLQSLYELRLAQVKAGKSIKRLPTVKCSGEVHTPTQKSIASS